MTHPVQYMSPWFRLIHASASELNLRVVYGVLPTSAAQATGFGGQFTWDLPLLDGYDAHVLEPQPSSEELGAERFSPVDSDRLESAFAEFRPDVVVVPGWHAALYRHALDLCRKQRIPAIYRGDSNFGSSPAGWRHPLWRAHSRRQLARYSGFLSVGARSREYLLALGAPEPLVFHSPHAVDNAFFAQAAGRRTREGPGAARASLGLRADGFVVLFVGKLVAKKRPLDAIRAVARVEGSELLVAGSGPLDESCRDEASRLGAAVRFAGFLNQRELLNAYTAADCLIVPSDGRETWGLVVNEALAAGLPVVVSDRVGCQPDLVVEGETGAIAPVGDVTGLAAALGRVRERSARGDLAAECQEHVSRYSYDAATRGLVAASARLTLMANATRASQASTRVIACCTQMVTPGGLERMTFEVLRTLNGDGAFVQCQVNAWDSARIVRLAENAGVAWSIGYHWRGLRWPAFGLRHPLMQLWEVLRSSASLLRLAARVRPTHILAPDFLIPVRHAPAFLVLRMLGCRIILRVGMAPEPGRRFARLWKTIVAPLVDRVVCNSDFIAREVLACGVTARKVGLIRNTVARRSTRALADRDLQKIIYVGQIIPGKGVDLLIEALDQLRRARIAATLDIVGDMDGWESPTYAGYRDSLRALADQEDVRGAVRFLGVREDIPYLMASAAVHCLPSRLEIREGMAGVVLEAKAAGTPSVVTTSGSLPELVTSGHDGWVVEPNARALAVALAVALQDAGGAARAGNAARASLTKFGRPAFDSAWLAEFGISGASNAEHVAARPSEWSGAVPQ
jgi:glycosyltransferase involved in cell wall biosynthesis